MQKQRLVTCFIICLSLTLISSGLKRKYKYVTGFDNFYIDFKTKKSFVMNMYSCTYTDRVSGNYQITKDTIYLSFTDLDVISSEKKWVRIDTNNQDGKQHWNAKLKFLNKFRKLIRTDNDKVLIPSEINKPFRSK